MKILLFMLIWFLVRKWELRNRKKMKIKTLRRIDNAIERLRNDTGPYIDPVSVLQSIKRLEKKRRLVEEDNYVIHKMNVEAVRVIGVLICENVKSR